LKVSLERKYTEAGNAVTFILKPEKPVNWIAGQYTRYQLKTERGLEEHFFTIASAPYEKHFQITTRISDSTFKQALNNLNPGDTITAFDPEGDFIWQETDHNRVFVAGGIGVTPFHSIIKDRDHNGDPIPVTLLYANRNDDIPFKAEVDRWRAEHPEFNVAYVIGEQLSAKLIAEHLPKLKNSLVYISGAEPMVEAIGNGLRNIYKLPDAQIIQDFFPGYTDKTF
jgi:ferredoxin-NADP reductase